MLPGLSMKRTTTEQCLIVRRCRNGLSYRSPFFQKSSAMQNLFGSPDGIRRFRCVFHTPYFSESVRFFGSEHCIRYPCLIPSRSSAVPASQRTETLPTAAPISPPGRNYALFSPSLPRRERCRIRPECTSSSCSYASRDSNFLLTRYLRLRRVSS